MTYNPADYNAVMDEAKGMPKEDLEEYYTKDKSKQHKSCCEIAGMILFGLFFVFMIGALGYVIGQDYLKDTMSEKIEIIEDEICPLIYEDYKSPEFFKSSLIQNQIICD